MSFYVKRSNPATGRGGWTGPIRSERQADKEVAAWQAVQVPAYLASMLACVDGTAYLAFKSPNVPILVTPADTGDSFRGVVMPIRLTG